MADAPREGQILTGPLFSEPMRVETVAASGPAAWSVGLVGTQSQGFRRVSLTKDQLASLAVVSPVPTYDGDATRLKLGLQAYASASSASSSRPGRTTTTPSPSARPAGTRVATRPCRG